MEEEGRNDELPVTDLVYDDATDKDSEAEALKTCPTNLAKLSASKSELSAPVGQNAPTNSEPNACSKNCHEPCPEKPSGVGSESVFFDIHNEMMSNRLGSQHAFAGFQSCGPY